MTSPAVGVFPLGPRPDMQAELYRREQIIASLCRALQRVRSEINDQPESWNYWFRIYDRGDGKCVICGRDRGGRSSDLDSLFCSEHCIVCSGADILLERPV